MKMAAVTQQIAILRRIVQFPAGHASWIRHRIFTLAMASRRRIQDVAGELSSQASEYWGSPSDFPDWIRNDAKNPADSRKNVTINHPLILERPRGGADST
jgi:hypothetical protein